MKLSEILTLAGAALLIPMTLLAGTHEITWHTVDGGGASGSSASVGGSFALSGTIGQPDAVSPASPLMGGTFELVGGFWQAPSSQSTCACPGDMNGDAAVDGLDIRDFTDCMIEGGSCQCADVDLVGGVSLDDVPAFVATLLSGDGCP